MRNAVDNLLAGLEVAGAALISSLATADAARVVFVAQGLARDLPWHAIRSEGAFLGDRFELVQAESFSSLRKPSPVAAETSVSMAYDDQAPRNYEVIATRAQPLGIAAVLHSPTAQDVVALAPMVRDDSRAGAQGTPGEASDPLVGHVLVSAGELAKHLGAADEDLDELNQIPDEEACTKERDLLFAGHCDFDPQHPLLSGLRLTGGPMRFSAVLTGMDMREWRSVILAACESGLTGRALPAEEPGIASAFLGAGVDYVVSTLWPVDKWASAVFVDHLLATLRIPNQSFPGAFRSAVRQLRELSAEGLAEWSGQLQPQQRRFVLQIASSAPRPFSHPYFWAAYVLNGVG